MIRPVLAELTRDYPELRLRIVSSEFPDWPEVPLEKVRWTVEDEPRSLATADIGVMPLSDDEWSRGKCAFKLLQYMSAGLPCVASPVGANRQAVVHGRTGYLAGTLEEWAASLRRLLDSSERRATFGLAGRRRVEDSYSRSTITPRTVRALRSALD
jgi:glycosyltransferase involved in cell wall biosynthesis